MIDLLLAHTPDQSIPRSPRTRTASGFTCVTSCRRRTPRSRHRRKSRSRASVIWLRALLWVHTKSTRMGRSDTVRLLRARPAAAMVISRSANSPSRRSRSARWRAMPSRCSASSGARSPSISPWSRHRRASRPASFGPRPRRRSATTRCRQASEVPLAVFAIPVLPARRRRKDPGLLVPADRRGGDAGAAGEFRDPHRGSLTRQG